MAIKNQLKTVVLLGLLTGLLLGAGQLIGGRTGLVIGLIFALLMNFGSYWFSDKIVLMMYRARKVTPEQEPGLHKIVDEVVSAANIPKPAVYIIPSPQANAMATGRSPKHAAIAATEGIMKLLNDEELKGVIAHEISHVKNRDVLVTTIAATIAGVISYMAWMAQWSAIFGGFGGRSRSGGSMISLLALAIITPIIAMMLQLAISRSREFLADETGAKSINNPHGLASALEKLEAGVKQNPMRNTSNAATASLFIVNPFRGGAMMRWLSTHPPMHERVKRLRSMQL